MYTFNFAEIFINVARMGKICILMLLQKLYNEGVKHYTHMFNLYTIYNVCVFINRLVFKCHAAKPFCEVCQSGDQQKQPFPNY